ncbi:MAG: hypothetical protein MZW92_00100 [Comamonadaceae bacterium]|nr:hypothetical protein [Comamonadaceae bacterium]
MRDRARRAAERAARDALRRCATWSSSSRRWPRRGFEALHKVPLDVLQRALEQLEGLVVNWSPAGLANLRSKMAVAVIDREHMDPAKPKADAYRTSAVVDATPARRKPKTPSRSDDEALAAAYAALGNLAPTTMPPLIDLEPASGPAARRAAPTRTTAVPRSPCASCRTEPPRVGCRRRFQLRSPARRAGP